MQTDTWYDHISDWLTHTSVEFEFTVFIIYDLFLVFLLWRWHNVWLLFYTNLGAIVLIGALCFSDHLICGIVILFAPVTLPMVLYIVQSEARGVKKYIKEFSQNVPSEVVVVLGYADWSKTTAWIKPNAGKGEVKTLIELLQAKKQKFSIYPRATQQDVEKIMADKNIKEVYFVGHGSSHKFQLGTEDILYYCDFNDAKYGKEYVHQIHCGTPDGKSLVDYVVPERNKNGCFFVRKLLRADQIEKELKRRTKEVVTQDF